MNSQRYDRQPPEWPLRLLRFLLKDEYLEEIEGDMEEIFQTNVEQMAAGKARRLYTLEMLRLIRPTLLKNFKSSPTFNYSAMYKSYFKIEWTKIINKKEYSFNNILGLGLAISSSILIFQNVHDE